MRVGDEKGTDCQFMGVRCRVRDRSRDFFRETENAGDAIRNPVRFPRVAKRRRVAIGGCRRRAVCAPATVRSRERRREFGAILTFASMGVAKTCGDGGTGGGREGTGRQSTGLDFVTGLTSRPVISRGRIIWAVIAPSRAFAIGAGTRRRDGR